MMHFKESLVRKIYDRIFNTFFIKSIDVAFVQNDHEEKEYKTLINKKNKSLLGKVYLLPLHFSRTNNLLYNLNKGPKDKKVVDNIRCKLGIPEKNKIIICLGRFHSGKGFLRVIETFYEYQKQFNPESHLLLIGKEFGFKSEIERKIKYLGIGHSCDIIEDIYDDRFLFYYASDLFLGFPTIFEETMLASIEALSCGTPIIVSKEADIPLVFELGAGFVINYSLKESVEKVNIILSNSEKYSLAAFAASQKFSEKESKKIFLNILSNEINLREKS